MSRTVKPIIEVVVPTDRDHQPIQVVDRVTGPLTLQPERETLPLGRRRDGFDDVPTLLVMTSI